MARSVKHKRGGSGYAGLISFIVLSIVLIVGYAWLIPQYAKVCTSLNQLHELVKDNLEARLGELNLRGVTRASTSDLAYDSDFFRKVGDAALAGIKYPELEGLTGWQGVDAEGGDAIARIRDELRKTTPVPDSLQDLIIALRSECTELEARLKMCQTDKDKAVKGWEDELRASEDRRKRFADERAEAAMKLEEAREKYKTEIAEMKALMNKAEENAKSAWAGHKAAEDARKKAATAFEDRIARLESEILTLQEEIERMRAPKVAVDEGRVLQVDIIDGFVIIGLGKHENVSAGDKFKVLRPGKGGELEPKGELQVVRVDKLVSRADIMSMEEGDTILRDDIVIRVENGG